MPSAAGSPVVLLKSARLKVAVIVAFADAKEVES